MAGGIFSLAGKVAIVTGCGAVEGWGNGKAIATLFARQGAAVFGTDVNTDAAEATRGVIAEEGGTVAVTRCDATDPAQVAAMAADASTASGGSMCW